MLQTEFYITAYKVLLELKCTILRHYFTELYSNQIGDPHALLHNIL